MSSGTARATTDRFGRWRRSSSSDHSASSVPSDDLVGVDASLPRDRRRGQWVIARDDDRLDARHPGPGGSPPGPRHAADPRTRSLPSDAMRSHRSAERGATAAHPRRPRFSINARHGPSHRGRRGAGRGSPRVRRSPTLHRTVVAGSMSSTMDDHRWVPPRSAAIVRSSRGSAPAMESNAWVNDPGRAPASTCHASSSARRAVATSVARSVGS